MKAMIRHIASFGIFLYLNAPLFAHVDSLYIQRFPDKLVISPYLSSHANVITFIPGDNRANQLIYQPNMQGGIGIGISYRIFDFSIGLRMPITEESERINGKTDAFNIGVRMWATRRILTEASYYRIQGYRNQFRQDTANGWNGQTPFYHRRDLAVQYLNLSAVYQFNPERFSYRSAFAFSERQLKSSSGFLLKGNIHFNETRGDSALIPTEFRGPYKGFGESRWLSSIAAGIAPGIGGTLTRGRWYISGVLFIGADLQYLTWSDGPQGTSSSQIRLSPAIDIRMAIGYNAPRFFVGIQNWNDHYSHRPGEVTQNTSFGRALLSIGWRLDAPKKLSYTYDKALNTLVPTSIRKFLY